MSLLNRYVINYLIWWYLVQGKEVVNKIIQNWIFVMNILNIGPMVRNLFQPLYQDYSRMGRVIAFPIRLTWVITGLFIGVLLLPIFIFILCTYFLIPLFSFYGIISYLINF